MNNNNKEFKFNYIFIRVPGWNTPDKTLLVINGDVICVANRKERCEKLIEFAYDPSNETLCPNKKIQKRILEALKKRKDL